VYRIDFDIEKSFWIMRDYLKWSGCILCEIAYSLYYEWRI
jgi:hypothetical protein